MVSFDTFVRRFTKLPKYIEKQGLKVIMSEAKRIVQMQREQHHAGVNREGNKMQSGYSSQYGKRRKKKGLQTSFVDLHYSGKYHKSLNLVPVKGGVDVQSDEPYAYYLRGMFPKMAGLTKSNADIVAEAVADKLAVDIKKYLVK